MGYEAAPRTKYNYRKRAGWGTPLQSCQKLTVRCVHWFHVRLAVVEKLFEFVAPSVAILEKWIHHIEA